MAHAYHAVEPAESTHPARSRWDRTAISRLAGFMLFIALVLAISGGRPSHLTAFFDLTSNLLVLGGTLSLLLMSFGFADTLSALSTLLGGSRSTAQALLTIAWLRFAALYALGTGLLGSLIGLIKLLAYLSDPASLGVAVGLTLLSQLYGGLIGLLCIAGAAILSRHVEPDNPRAGEHLTTQALPVALAAAGYGAASVVLISLALMIALR